MGLGLFRPKQSQTIEISAVVFQEGSCWIAQGLQYDISAQADTIGELHKKFVRSIMANVAICLELGRRPLEGVGAAPQKFWDMFETSELLIQPEHEQIEPHSPTPAIRPKIKLAECRAA